ncbi:MAG: hypothetical protein GW886_05945 [Rhodobacterales bacterium]|nr:hypothetical protein [Rhodobacterales bacterium]NCT13377.1 hypothetical protein [Rhodobacterales bacterium]
MTADRGTELRAAPERRLFALGCLYVLGALLIWLALVQPPAPLWLVFLLVLGGLVLALAEAMRRASALTLRLTDAGLADSAGRVIARWEDIARIEQGTFAAKPANGFVIVLNEHAARGWAPGMWWRMGRRIGVGGITARRHARAMAEAMAARLAARETEGQ